MPGTGTCDREFQQKTLPDRLQRRHAVHFNRAGDTRRMGEPRLRRRREFSRAQHAWREALQHLGLKRRQRGETQMLRRARLEIDSGAPGLAESGRERELQTRQVADRCKIPKRCRGGILQHLAERRGKRLRIDCAQKAASQPSRQPRHAHHLHAMLASAGGLEPRLIGGEVAMDYDGTAHYFGSPRCDGAHFHDFLA